MATPEEQAQSMLRNLEEKTGRSISKWLAVVKKTGLAKHGAIVKMLKADHGVTHGYANLIAHESLGSAAIHSDAGDLVLNQYAKKESLRPIYDRLVKAIAGFGKDVEIAPKKSYVSLRRKKQFARIYPSPGTRGDVGVRRTGTAPKGRLEASGSFNAMVSHRVKISKVSEVNDALIGWLRKAYDAAG